MIKGNFWCMDCTCNKTGDRKFTADIEDADSKEEVFCPHNPDLKLKLMGTQAFTIGTHELIRGKGRTKQDKDERRKKSFHDTVMPYIGGFEKKHFEKKFGKAK